jgi:cell division topological specificity factor
MLNELIEKLFGPRESASRDTVKQRLKIVLAHDRSDLSSETLDKMRREILAVVSRYVEIDFESLEFSLATDQRVTALVANLPIRRVRTDPLAPDSPVIEQEQLNLDLAAEEMYAAAEPEISTTADIPLV